MTKAIDTITTVIAELNKEFGPETVIWGSQILYSDLPRISSGSYSLDMALGGGWQTNAWHEIYGDECLCPGTRILRTDLTWANIEDLQVGDEIIGFDEELGGWGRGGAGRYRRSTVTRLGRTVLPVFKLTTRHGDTYASAGHLWLTHRMTPRAAGGRRSQQRQWVRTDELNVGNKIASIGAPWETDHSWEAGYLAGFYDGEGWVSDKNQGGRRVGCAQVQGPTSDRVLRYLEKLGFNPLVGPRKRPEKYPHWQDQIHWAFPGRYEDMRFLGTVRPERLLEKSSGIWEGTCTKSVYESGVKVQSVEYVGEREVVTIGTSTKTLIADGLLSHNSSGKTTIILKTIATQQALNPEHTTFWVAAEEFVPAWARELGCDTDRILIMQTNILEEATNAAIRVLESRTVDILVFDSLPALSPVTESEGTMDDQQVALVARLLPKFFRKAYTAMKRSLVEEDRPVTCLIVNQWRERPGIPFGDPRITPGGRAKNYWFTTRVELKRDDWLTEGDRKNQRKVGITIKALTKKNKSYPPERVAVFDFYFDHNELQIPPGVYDGAKELITQAILYDMFQIKGSYYHLGDDSWHGRAALEEQVRWDLTLQQKLRDAIQNHVVKGKHHEETRPSLRRLARTKAKA